MELLPLIDNESFKIKGFAERTWIHQQNLCHLTTLLIPIDVINRKVAIHTRSLKKRSWPGYKDFFGGHVSLDKDFWPFLLGNPFDMEAIILSSGIREANEELRMLDNAGNPAIIDSSYLTRFQSIGDFKWNNNSNFERSTLYLIKIPQNYSIHPMDDVDNIFEPVVFEFKSLDEIITIYREKSWKFADGAERILERLIQNEDLTQELKSIINRI
jgi:hypothetical protein